MSRSRCRLLLQAGLILCGLATVVAAQEPAKDPALLLRADSEQRARWATEWLNSEDPQRVAWGAWLARQDHQTALIPPLITKVEEYQPTNLDFSSGADRDRHDALLAVLDALIALSARLPAEQAHKLYAEFPAQSLILLIRAPDDKVPALFDIFQRAKANWNWLAAGNVLVKTRPPGFAALLLSRFTQHLTVSVYDPRQGGGGGSGGGECMWGMGAPKTGWPAVGLYQLMQFPDLFTGIDSTFLVGGDTPVYYLRTQPGNYDNRLDIAGSCNDGNRDQYRAQYLTRLLENSSPRIALDPYPQLYISWEGESPYRQQLIGAVNDRVAEFRHALWRLQESHLLTTAEATGLKPRLEIVISDQRSDRSTPLPHIPQDDEGVITLEKFTKPLD